MDLVRANRLTVPQIELRSSNTNLKHMPFSRLLLVAGGLILFTATPLFAQSPSPSRFWSDNSGTFSVEAKLLKINSASVKLRKQNKVIIEVPFSRLSKLDMDFVKRQISKNKPYPTNSKQVQSMLGTDFVLDNSTKANDPTIHSVETFDEVEPEEIYNSQASKQIQFDPYAQANTSGSNLNPKPPANKREFAPRPSARTFAQPNLVAQKTARTVDQQSKPQALLTEPSKPKSVPATDQATLPTVTQLQDSSQDSNSRFSLGTDYQKPPIVLVSPKANNSGESATSFENSLRPNQNQAASQPKASPYELTNEVKQPAAQSQFAARPTVQKPETNPIQPTQSPTNFVPPTNQFSSAATNQFNNNSVSEKTSDDNGFTSQFKAPSVNEAAKQTAPDTQFTTTQPQSTSIAPATTDLKSNSFNQASITPATQMKPGSLSFESTALRPPSTPAIQPNTPLANTKPTPTLPAFQFNVSKDQSDDAFATPPGTAPRTSMYNTKSTIRFVAPASEIDKLPTSLQYSAKKLIEAKQQSDVRMSLEEIASNWPNQPNKILTSLVKQCMKSTDPLTRKLALETLATHDAEDSLVHIVHSIEDNDARVRMLAYETLGNLADPRSIPALAKQLASGDRDLAAAVLSKLGDQVEVYVAPYTRHESIPVQMTACSLLGRVGTNKSITPLESVAATTKEPKVRLQASNALQKIQSRTSLR